jgi:hypothetical protein
MSTTRSGSASSHVRGRAAIALVSVLLAGCTSTHPTGAKVTAGAGFDWRNRTYTVTCDGIVPDGFRAPVVDGAGRVAADASRPPHYDHYDIEVIDTASGDVDGDGAPDSVVLLQCSPQPSNGFLQEVHVFSSTGRSLGALPSPRTLQGDAPLAPLYDPGGLSVQHGEIIAEMTAYGPNDFHAGGPSLPLTVRWRFDGHDFVHVES